MLRLGKPGSIPTFAVLEVVFHPRPPILPAGVNHFHPHGTLPAWECTRMGFEFLRVRQFLLHKLEHKEWTALASYMMFGIPKELPLTFHARHAWIWKPPSLTSCIMSC